MHHYIRSKCIHFASFLDRKSTRLNSSHSQISYAVFCLKKKKKTEQLSASSASGALLHPASSPRLSPACTSPPISHSLNENSASVSKSPIEEVQRHTGGDRFSGLHGDHGLAKRGHDVTVFMGCANCIDPAPIHRDRMVLPRYLHGDLMIDMWCMILFFFFNEAAPPDFYPFPLHAPLPI